MSPRFTKGDADREVRRAWVTEFAKALQPHGDGAYIGVLTDDGPARIRSAYPGGTWDRLARIKIDLRSDQPVPVEPEHLASPSSMKLIAFSASGDIFEWFPRSGGH
jgi:hypothetical protein